MTLTWPSPSLGKWIEVIRVDGDGKIYVKWNSKAVFELLGLPSAADGYVSGNRHVAIGHSLQSIDMWHPAPLPATNQMSQPTFSNPGYSGFSGFAGNQAASSNCIGFSGFSGQMPPPSGWSTGSTGCVYSGFSGMKSNSVA